MSKNDKIILFDKISLADVLREIYEARNQNRILLTDAINSFRKKISNAESAAYVGSVVADLFEAVIKNDEHLLKLAAVVQKLEANSGKKEDNSLLTDAEKKQLLETVRSEQDGLKNEASKIRETVDKATIKLEEINTSRAN